MLQKKVEFLPQICRWMRMLFALAVVSVLGGWVAPVQAQVPSAMPNRTEWWRGGASLDMDFLRGRYMVSRTDAVITTTSLTAFLASVSGTFVRNTVATYFDADGVMRTAAVNEPRFDHDPLTGQPLGYLSEENRTNYLFPSANLSGWTVSGTVSLLSTTTAPDGGTAYSLSAATPMAGVWKSFAAANGGSSTLSIYVKNVTGSGAVVVGNDAATEVSGGVPALLTFDTTTGSVTSATATVAWQTVQPMKNGWYRLSLGYTSSGTTGRMVAYHGDGTPGENAFWGGQAERSYLTNTPSSYIPTTTAAVGRGVDAMSLLDAINTGWASPTGEGTLYISGVEYEYSWTSNYWPGFLTFSQDGDTGNLIHIRTGYNPSNVIYYEMLIGGAAKGVGVVNPGECHRNVHQMRNRVRLAYAFQQGNTNMACGGLLSATNSNAPNVALPLFNRLVLGKTRVAGDYMTGYLRHFTYFPYRAPDTFLQEITGTPVD